MAAFAFINARVEINSVDWSAWVTSVTLNFEAEDLETTAMGTGFRTRIAGLKDGSVDIEFNNDFVDNGLDEVLWGLWGTLTTVKIRPDAGAISANNPEYSGQVLVAEMNPLDGGVGDLAKRSVSWPTSGVWARATS